MAVLFAATVLASLLGSTHCVGMCGPLALWASGATEKKRTGVAINTMLYHAGRLVTYIVMGVAAGWIGELVNLGGETLGMRMVAARIVGGLMIAMGLWRLLSLLPRKSQSVATATAPSPSVVTRVLVWLRPTVFKLPAQGRAMAVGLLTAFLPCGWLYVFAFVAAGTASVFGGATVMVAFWIGTVPLLTGLVASASLVNKRFRMVIPVAGSILLVVTGAYTAAGNGFASADALPRLQSAVSEKAIEDLGEAPLPCCRKKECVDS